MIRVVDHLLKSRRRACLKRKKGLLNTLNRDGRPYYAWRINTIIPANDDDITWTSPQENAFPHPPLSLGSVMRDCHGHAPMSATSLWYPLCGGQPYHRHSSP